MNKPPVRYLFYDLETSGRNHCFAQPLQIVIYVTDAHLKVLERHRFDIRLREDVIPEIGAILTHKLPPSALLEGTSEYEALRQIHALVNTPNSHTIGYNSLKFDDLFLRFGFYRNGLAPYTHQWQGGCRRLDMLPITVLFYLYAPEALVFPTNAQGKPSFKLEDLMQANQLATGQAHDAEVDVAATVALAQKFKAAHPELWEYALGFFDKNEDKRRLYHYRQNIGGVSGVLLVDFVMGVASGFQQPVMILGQSNKDIHYLRLDHPKLQKLTRQNLTTQKWTRKKKLGEIGWALPWNKRRSAFFDAKRMALIESNVTFIQQNPTLIAQLAEYVLGQTYARVPGVDVDARLYQDGFWSAAERRFFDQFHEATDARGKLKVVDEARNSRARTLGERIVWRNYPEAIENTEKRREQDEFIRQSIHPDDESLVWIDYKRDQKMVIEQFLVEAKAILTKGEWKKLPLSDDDRALLEAWKGYVESKR